MTPEQIKLIVEAYLQAAKRPDGRDSTISEYIRYILDGDIDLVTSKDCVILDEANQLIHAIFVNEDMNAQASFPIKVLSTDYSIVQKIEGVFSQANFERFLNEGFLADLLSEEKKEFIINYTRSRSNLMQAQQPREAEPFFNTNPTIIPMPHKRIEREEYVPAKVKSTNANGEAVYFANMKEAFTAVNEGKISSLTLTDNVVVGKDDEITIDSGNAVTINLAGNTIKSSEAVTLFNVSSGSLVLEGSGTIETSGEVLRAYTKDGSAATITVGPDVKIISNDDTAAYVRGKGAVLTTEGTIVSNSKKYAAVMGNGTDSGAIINVLGGTIRSNSSIAIYHPQDGVLNIENANIEGTVGVYTKAGTVNISGSTRIVGTGEFEAYEFNNNGANDTGDAIVADFCRYPGGYPKINISGGEFISKYNNAFACYTKDGATNPEQAPENVNISGGRFNSEVKDEWLAEGYEATKSGSVWTVAKQAPATVLTNQLSAMTADSVVTIDEKVTATESTEWFENYSYDFLMTNGGTLTGNGVIEGEESAIYAVIVNNEKNYPAEGDGAYETTVENVTIKAKGQTALYLQSIDADSHVNNVTVTKENNGVGIWAEFGGTGVTYLDGCNVTVPTTERTDECPWLQTAIAVSVNANLVVNSGVYTGHYALYIYSSGGSVTINGGEFNGLIAVDAGTLTIKGGTFSEKLKDEWIAEGYVANYDEETGKYIVIEA